MFKKILPLVLLLCVLLCACGLPLQAQTRISPDEIPAYAGEPYVVLNGNTPEFPEEDFTADSFETYCALDAWNRCGAAYANIGTELMPTGKRGAIGQVKPSGWQTVKYDCVDGKYLYNRCHLIGYQLTAENANERNLITGTRYLNVCGMLPFENLVADYVKETQKHVLYRVSPVFEGENLVASGVQMEAMSVEDRGESVMFNVYCYNVQPGIEIDYRTGESRLLPQPEGETETFVLNTHTKKIHLPDCASVSEMKQDYRQDYTGPAQTLLAQGYTACGRCRPLE